LRSYFQVSHLRVGSHILNGGKRQLNLKLVSTIFKIPRWPPFSKMMDIKISFNLKLERWHPYSKWRESPIPT